MRLIFLNGWSASSQILGNLAEALSKEHDLIVINHLYQFCNDEINSKIDEVMTEDSVLIGWSLGGLLAMQYLIQMKSAQIRPKGLILLQSTPCFIQKNDWPHAVNEVDFSNLEALVGSHSARQFIRHFSQLMVAGSDFPQRERSMLNAVFTEKLLPSRDVLLKGLSYLRQLDLREALSSIELPVYAIFGLKDALISVEVKIFMEKSFAYFRADVVPGMGHFPFGEKLEGLLDGMMLFLNSLSSDVDVPNR
jgi:pimeloyl-[acyl-carrier protein] methyl ester esterase